MPDPVIRAIAWSWDRARGIAWARARLSDGQTFAVGVPLSTVVATFDAELQAAGVHEPASIGECASVSGLFGRIKRLSRTASRATKRATRRATKRLNKKVWRSAKKWGGRYTGYTYAKKYAMKAARSKELRAGLGVAAVAMPAVGGPALGAWVAANRAVAQYDQGKAALQRVRRGLRSPQAMRAIRSAATVQRAARGLARSRHPAARMYSSALRSLR